jgi:tRNA/rRNA methyltransferase
MPGSGTDKTKRWIVQPGPAVVLVEPQLGENIGAAARAMANFGLAELRLVKPQQRWPNPKAKMMASGADRILDRAQVHDTLRSAIADCTLVFATTARAHDQAKPVLDAPEAVRRMAPHVAGGESVALVFGRERYGLENDEVALADSIVTLPVNPAFASLNLAQAVAVIAYEWFKLASDGALPFGMPVKSAPAPKQQLHAFFDSIERELDRVEFFRPPEKRATMLTNLQNIFHRMQPTQQDIQTLHGVIMAIAEGRKGPARGGVLDGEEAARLRALLAEHAQARAPSERAPVRGLSRLLRRNPTDAERLLWEALTRDRRFAGRGFRRQTPIGPHIVDLVSFPLRLVVEIVPVGEGAAATEMRAQRRSWLEQRGYTVIEVNAVDIEGDSPGVIEELQRRVAGAAPAP